MEEWLAFVSYIGVMSITPGPNNIMLAASGVNFGFRRTLPHILGISLGCAVQLLICTLALSEAVHWVHALQLPLAIAGCGYLLWLSWQLARAGAPGRRDSARPMSFSAAALFQWVNPKAWLMVVNTGVLFMPARSDLLSGTLALALFTLLVNLPCVSVWALGGDSLRRQLSRPAARHAFNLCMAGLMGGTALWLANEQLAALWGRMV